MTYSKGTSANTASSPPISPKSVQQLVVFMEVGLIPNFINAVVFNCAGYIVFMDKFSVFLLIWARNLIEKSNYVYCLCLNFARIDFSVLFGRGRCVYSIT